jgi:hypothetical protein
MWVIKEDTKNTDAAEGGLEAVRESMNRQVVWCSTGSTVGVES